MEIIDFLFETKNVKGLKDLRNLINEKLTNIYETEKENKIDAKIELEILSIMENLNDDPVANSTDIVSSVKEILELNLKDWKLLYKGDQSTFTTILELINNFINEFDFLNIRLMDDCGDNDDREFSLLRKEDYFIIGLIDGGEFLERIEDQTEAVLLFANMFLDDDKCEEFKIRNPINKSESQMTL